MRAEPGSALRFGEAAAGELGLGCGRGIGRLEQSKWQRECDRGDPRSESRVWSCVLDDGPGAQASGDGRLKRGS